MKQLLFLLLFPCLALAQYQGNEGQKITLGEQTTADGLVWRGLRADTTSKIVPFSDTSAYIILDTVEKTLWLYKAGQVPKWQQVGGSTLDTATMLLPYYRAGRTGIIQAADVPTLNQNTTGSAATLTTGRTIQTNLASTSAATFNGSANITPGVTGTLLVANGGTGADMSSLPNNYLIRKNSSGVFDTSLIYEAGGKVGIGMSSPTEALHVIGNARITGNLGLITNTGTNTTFLTLGTGTGAGFSRLFMLTGNGGGQGEVTIASNTGVAGAITGATAYSMVLGTSSTSALHLSTSEIVRATITSSGNVGIGTASPTAVLHLKAGTATAAPIRLTSGVNLTSPLGGEMEFNGTNLFFSPSTTRHTVNHGLTGSATLNFPSTTTLLSADLTITVTGAADGDVVSLGVPNAAVNANTSYSAWVSAANTVTVRFNNYSSGTVDPASGLFKVFVTK